jgi:hypothetical protein
LDDTPYDLSATLGSQQQTGLADYNTYKFTKGFVDNEAQSTIRERLKIPLVPIQSIDIKTKMFSKK